MSAFSNFNMKGSEWNKNVNAYQNNRKCAFFLIFSKATKYNREWLDWKWIENLKKNIQKMFEKIEKRGKKHKCLIFLDIANNSTKFMWNIKYENKLKLKKSKID